MQEISLFMQHHVMLSVAFFVILVLLMIIELIKQKTDSAQLTPAQLTQLINRENAAVIDIRTAAHYAAGHIIGSISIPFADLDSKPKKLEKFKSRPIVIVDTLGNDAIRAAATLAKRGVTTRLLKGGITAWKQADMPVIKD
jgi:rhodanese-related sulfurtransferase